MANVLSHLPQAALTHFACHAAVDRRQVLDSAIILAGGDRLSLRELLRTELPVARLAVLSACSSALVGAELQDEVVSFPSALAQAGVAGVVGSLWAVDDVATAVLLTRFYDGWLTAACPGLRRSPRRSAGCDRRRTARSPPATRPSTWNPPRTPGNSGSGRDNEISPRPCGGRRSSSWGPELPAALDSALVAALIALPGAGYTWGFEQAVSGWGTGLADRTLRFVAGSAVFAVITAPLSFWIYHGQVASGWLARGQLWWPAWPLLIGYVIVPFAVGRITGHAVQAGRWWPRLLVGRRPPRAHGTTFSWLAAARTSASGSRTRRPDRRLGAGHLQPTSCSRCLRQRAAQRTGPVSERHRGSRPGYW